MTLRRTVIACLFAAAVITVGCTWCKEHFGSLPDVDWSKLKKPESQASYEQRLLKKRENKQMLPPGYDQRSNAVSNGYGATNW